ncbi:MAG TPA: anhydro-N-acetylmuramic acid kinase [Rhizomicrobium sp.]|nr:anhydro-N-acetylmuramic acid kinase [Rhizomicrobium sp.]
MAEALKVVGLMSGTSLDGIDAAVLDTDGEGEVHPGPALAVPYAAGLRADLQRALASAAALSPGDPVLQSIRDVERAVTEAHADVVLRLLRDAGLAPRDVALIGFHGQTILHRPKERRSWQIGDGPLLAKLTGIDVVNDFRSADMRAGGEGAPFVPLYHAALVRAAALGLPVVVVNIGGVGNVTFCSAGMTLAFDTGPGNAAIDDWAQAHTGKPFDEDGRLAAAGKADAALVARMLAHPYFQLPPPKSLDRMDFGTSGVAHLSPADGAATLTAFTAAAIAEARTHFPETPATWIVSGGGRRNPQLMIELAARVRGTVVAAEALGWRGDFVEAEAFAYLAVRASKGLPLSLPTTTGVPTPTTGGQFHRA